MQITEHKNKTMEITNEVMAKVFAQYLGQRLTRNSIVSGYFLDMPVKSNEFKLILKPISAITDEDAIEVAKIVSLHYNPKIESRENGLLAKTTLSCGDSVVYIYHAGKIEHWRNDIDKPISILSAYQYLISKGYDLPHYLLGGKTLYEAGLAIYE